MRRWLVILWVSLYIGISAADDADQTRTLFFRDAKNYLETIKQAKNIKLDEQLELWKNFLVQYPETFFKEEIQYNLSQLEDVLGIKSKTTKELSGTYVFLEAQKHIVQNGFSVEKQILLWKQFLSEQPGNPHTNEIKGMISALQFSLQKK